MYFVQIIIPLSISLLKSLIPITKLDSSTNCVTFSDGFNETKGLKAALGITLSKAAATSFSTLKFFNVLFKIL